MKYFWSRDSYTFDDWLESRVIDIESEWILSISFIRLFYRIQQQ